jgi:hypothetical protein
MGMKYDAADNSRRSYEEAIRLMRNKYRNKPTEVNGIRFDSQKEAKRYGELCLLYRAGDIRDLQRQYKFSCDIGDDHICNYMADFVYFDVSKNRRVVEDVKGAPPTAVFKLKKKLVEALHDVQIEIT